MRIFLKHGKDTVMKKRDATDIISGLFLTAVGLFFAFYAMANYGIGTLSRMGPGYFPVALGFILAVLGLLVFLPALGRSGEAPKINWKALFIIIGSIVVFGATLKVLGIVVATMITVVVASLADDEITWKERAILAAVVAPLVYLIFIFGLGMTIRTWPWSY
jgi:hypothetical protein